MLNETNNPSKLYVLVSIAKTVSEYGSSNSTLVISSHEELSLLPVTNHKIVVITMA